MSRTQLTFNTLHSWTKEYMLDNVKWIKTRYGVDVEKECRFWVFRYKHGGDWAYLVTGPGYSWSDAREGHIRMAIADGWVPEEEKLEYFQ